MTKDKELKKYDPDPNTPNNFIRRILFASDFRCYKSGELFCFEPGINLLVGDQGCGKSTMFYSVMNHVESGIQMDYNANSSYQYLDTEFMNPRLESAFKENKEFETVVEYDKAVFESFLERNSNNEKSHGEVILPLIMGAKGSGVTFFIDEPEAGLSVRSQYKAFKFYQELAKTNQLIIATHSPIFMRQQGKVLSLEHRKWMSANDFLETQKIK